MNQDRDVKQRGKSAGRNAQAVEYAAPFCDARAVLHAHPTSALEKLASGRPFKRDWHPLVVLFALYLIAMSVEAPFGL